MAARGDVANIAADATQCVSPILRISTYRKNPRTGSMSHEPLHASTTTQIVFEGYRACRK